MHTPGPWEVDGVDRTQVIKLPDHTDRPRLTVEQTVKSPIVGEAEANARLIAAAPEMLAALKLVWSMFDDGRIVRNIANDGKPDWALKMLTFTRELQTIHAAIVKAESTADAG